MMNDHFIREFSSIIEMSPLKINDDLNLKGLAEWDSIACLTTITLVDRCFKVLLSNDDFTAVHYFRDLKNVIAKKFESEK